MTVDRSQVEAFIYREARLSDEHCYDEWLSLWADEGIYWVPCNGGDTDPTREVSFIYDDRARLGLRVDRLKSGLAYAQKPKSLLRRVVSNLEIEAGESDEMTVHSNFILIELRKHLQNVWTGTTIHRLRWENGGFKIVMKKVILLNNDEEIPPMGFLI
ncbi:MAG: aromatic-ring-hydroxylating dioxygenase subunit beta [Deltaproteobacteria bacterium]|nr:aromatic-ring-hydroxylating dioxygenase subunit beta [Deltaproteobacteria bacterium]